MKAAKRNLAAIEADLRAAGPAEKIGDARHKMTAQSGAHHFSKQALFRGAMLEYFEGKELPGIAAVKA